ncbi:hypothetical protein V1519DRAFT_455594 [Lipomyces tetrasporus]
MAGGYGNDQPQGFSNLIEKVAIVGAGGQVGNNIAKHLLSRLRPLQNTALTDPFRLI